MSDRSEYNRRYYEKTKERTKEARSKAAKEHWARTRDAEAIAKRYQETKVRHDHPCYAMWYAAKQRAKMTGREFTIELEDLVIPELCPITLEPLTFNGPRATSPSLDRVDNSKGYVKGNVQIISNRANTRKGDLSLEELERLITYVRSHSGSHPTVPASNEGHPDTST